MTSQPVWRLLVGAGSEVDRATPGGPADHRGERATDLHCRIGFREHRNGPAPVDLEHEIGAEDLVTSHAGDIVEQGVEHHWWEVPESSTIPEIDRVDPHLAGAHPHGLRRGDRPALRSAHLRRPRRRRQAPSLLVESDDGVHEQVPECRRTQRGSPSAISRPRCSADVYIGVSTPVAAQSVSRHSSTQRSELLLAAQSLGVVAASNQKLPGDERADAGQLQ